VTKWRRGTHAIQRGGDVLVRPLGAHLAYDIVNLGGVSHHVLARLWLADPQLGVLPTSPVDHEHDLTLVVVHVDDDLLNQTRVSLFTQAVAVADRRSTS
jgi:hypothetical protein